LKCPPALIASGALQSPFSCTWKPNWRLGGRSRTSARTSTLPSNSRKETLPQTLLPDFASSFADATVPPSSHAQPARLRDSTTPVITCSFIFVSSFADCYVAAVQRPAPANQS